MSSTPRTKYGEYKEKLKEWSRLFEDEYGRRPTDDDRYDSATWVALNDKARHYRRLAGEEATPSPLKRSGSRGSRRHLDRSARGAAAPVRACKTGCAAARPARCRCGSRSASKTSERGAARTGGRDRPQGRTDQQSDVGGRAYARRGGFGGGSGRRANIITERREWGPGALRPPGRMYSFRVFGRPLEPAEPALRLPMSW